MSVRSCVVVLTGTIVPEVTIKQMPDDVMVLDRMDVPRWFKKRPEVLTPDEVEAIYAVARWSDTWVKSVGRSIATWCGRRHSRRHRASVPGPDLGPSRAGENRLSRSHGKRSPGPLVTGLFRVRPRCYL